MNGCFITFRSVTHAQRGEQLLGGGGIFCRILRTPRWMEERGCGYGAEVRLPSLSQGLRLLNEEGIPFRKYYAINRDGRVEEVRDDLS